MVTIIKPLLVYKAQEFCGDRLAFYDLIKLLNRAVSQRNIIIHCTY